MSLAIYESPDPIKAVCIDIQNRNSILEQSGYDASSERRNQNEMNCSRGIKVTNFTTIRTEREIEAI
jgi:hypothetical protein